MVNDEVSLKVVGTVFITAHPGSDLVLPVSSHLLLLSSLSRAVQTEKDRSFRFIEGVLA